MFARSGPFVGFIQDLDYGKLVLREGGQKMEPEIERSLKDIISVTVPQTAFMVYYRQGTFQFMAIEVLSSNGDIRHEVKHDLESFFWQSSFNFFPLRRV
jgi:hypothetical protein